MTAPMELVLITIAVALVFDFINGFHDAANSIATVVSTRVLSPKLAVVWAAFFNFAAAFIFGTAVAKAIASGIIDPQIGQPTEEQGEIDMAGLHRRKHRIEQLAVFGEPGLQSQFRMQ